MKKILVSLMLLVMTALSAHAQFEKEVWYVNASLTGLDQYWCTRTLLFFQLRYLWRIGNGV